MKKSLLALLSAGLMIAGMNAVQADGGTGPENKMNDSATIQKETVKKTIARTRGRLLYRKNQARKMERAVEAANPETKAKIAELRKQIADLYIAHNPKIADNYAEQKNLEGQIAALKQ